MRFTYLFNRTKRHRRAPRVNQFVLESLEPRVLLSATPMTAAVVTTDHLDYAPGETAIITTSNQTGEGLQFAVGELVRFQVSRTDGILDAAGSTADVGPAGNEAWYVVDGMGGFAAHQEFDANGQAIDRDANGMADWIAPDNDLTVNGSISTTWFVEEQYRSSSLLVTAVGQASGAVATQAFTDALTHIITTVAGTTNLSNASFGDGGPATSAGFRSPQGAAVDAAGNLYIADAEDRRVRRVDAVTHIITTVAGTTNLSNASFGDGGPATSAGFRSPQGVAVDAAGNLYIADAEDRRVRRVDAVTHIITTVAGTTNLSNASFGDGGPATSAGFRSPQGVAVDAAGNLYIADAEDRRVRRVDAVTHIITTVAGTTNLSNASFGDGGPATSAGFRSPQGAAVDAAGNLYIADAEDRRVRRVDAVTHIITTVAGTTNLSNASFGDGGPATSAGFRSPQGVAVDAAGNLYIADAEDRRVRRVDAVTHIITTVAGTTNLSNASFGDGGPATSAGFLSPQGVAVDAAGNLYIADAQDRRVRRVDALAQTIIAVASNAATSTYGDSVTFTAIVTDPSGTATPTGSVEFFDGATSLGSVSNSATIGTGISTWTITTANLNAGPHTIHAVYTATGTFDNNTSGNITQTVNKANATITGNGLNGSGYFGTYDGQAHAATATVIGVGGANLGQVVSSTTHTNAGVYSDTLTYTDGTGNYANASKVVKTYILKATVTITGNGLSGSGYFGTYDGQAHAATATVTGVGGANLGQVVSSTTHTNAGTYSDTVAFLGDANYKAASKVVKSYILKAAVTITGNGLNGSGYFGTFDGQAHAATATVTGVGGANLGQVVSSTTHTNAGTYSDTVTFLGDANYKAASKVVKSYILKAAVTITGAGLNGSGYYGTYDGQAHAATATVTGVGGANLGQVVSSTTHTNAGIYSDTVTFLGDANYKAASKVVKSYILKAAVTITGNGLNGSGYFGTFDGQAHAATATVIGVGGVVLGQLTSSTTHTNVGIYSDTVTFLGDANYKAASKVLKSYII